MCAAALLSLAIRGRATFTDAVQHYHQALVTAATLRADQISDGTLFLHCVLLLFDICYAWNAASNPSNGLNIEFVFQHYERLVRIVAERHRRPEGERLSWIRQHVIRLEVEVCLLPAETDCTSYIDHGMLRLYQN